VTAAAVAFRPYDHLEKFDHSEVEGVDQGSVFVFPKLDGTNASVWMHDDGNPTNNPMGGCKTVECGSRSRHLLEGADNHGFRVWVQENRGMLREALRRLPRGARLYGEWMVPHSLKTYREEVWRRFWVFDVWVPTTESWQPIDHERGRYLSWDEYSALLEDSGVDLIMPLCVVDNPSKAQLQTFIEQNTYLIADGAGVGEGIVLKNYDWRNRYGRQPWAKIVRNAFKEQNAMAFGVRKVKGESVVEFEIAVATVTPELVGKTRAKVVADIANDLGVELGEVNVIQQIEEQHRGKVIPQLISRVYHDVVIEELWPQLKKHKNPTVDFKLLNRHVVVRTKALAADLFGGL